MGKGREVHPRRAKSSRPKERGRTGDALKFREQLGLLHLRIVEVTADGNCCFRAVSEQLEGNEYKHHEYRQQVVDYLEAHREEFEPFVEDEVPFDEYCQTMREDGTWAGNMELQAISLVTQCNICIHRLMFPRWHITNFDDPAKRTLHLSYHDGEHYNSVRHEDDSGDGPAIPIIIETDTASITKPSTNSSKVGPRRIQAGSAHVDESAVKMVVASTGCQDMSHVHKVLQEVHGDTDAAIEFLIAEMNNSPQPDLEPMVSETEEDGVMESDVDLRGNQEVVAASRATDDDDPMEASCAEGPNVEFSELPFAQEELPSSPENGAMLTRSKAARNKPCPCGSKKKYKACCGAVRPRSTPAAQPPSHPDLTNKARKERLRSAKAAPQLPTNGPRRRGPPSSFGVVDMGSLQI